MTTKYRIIFNEAKNLYMVQYKGWFLWHTTGYSQGCYDGSYWCKYQYHSLDEAKRGMESFKHWKIENAKYDSTNFWKVVWP